MMLDIVLIGCLILQGIYSTHRGLCYAQLNAKFTATSQELLDTKAKLSDTQDSLQELAKIKHTAAK